MRCKDDLSKSPFPWTHKLISSLTSHRSTQSRKQDGDGEFEIRPWSQFETPKYPAHDLVHFFSLLLFYLQEFLGRLFQIHPHQSAVLSWSALLLVVSRHMVSLMPSSSQKPEVHLHFCQPDRITTITLYISCIVIELYHLANSVIPCNLYIFLINTICRAKLNSSQLSHGIRASYGLTTIWSHGW